MTNTLLPWRRALSLFVATVLAILLSFNTVPAQSACENVKNLLLPNTMIADRKCTH
jgi:hypothetical protein